MSIDGVVVAESERDVCGGKTVRRLKKNTFREFLKIDLHIFNYACGLSLSEKKNEHRSIGHVKKKQHTNSVSERVACVEEKIERSRDFFRSVDSDSESAVCVHHIEEHRDEIKKCLSL